MKLWTVTVSDEFVVLAETADEAHAIASRSKECATLEAEPAQPMEDIPAGWDDDSIPLCSLARGLKTLRELIDAGHAPEYTATLQRLKRGAK